MYLNNFLCYSLASAAACQRQPSSEETSIIGMVLVAPGRFERFMEIQAQTLEYILQNEPGTLQLETYIVSQNASGTEVSFYEKYADSAARDIHQNSQNYAEYIATFERENILASAPNLLLGNFSQGFALPGLSQHAGRGGGGGWFGWWNSD